MIQMKDTAVLMLSEDYKVRFVAEYWQVKNRYDRLHAMVVKYEAGTLEFKADCPLDLLKAQKAAMGKYLYCLEIRAQIEKIDMTQPAEAYGKGELVHVDDYMMSMMMSAPENQPKPPKICPGTGRECCECKPGGCVE